MRLLVHMVKRSIPSWRRSVATLFTREASINEASWSTEGENEVRTMVFPCGVSQMRRLRVKMSVNGIRRKAPAPVHVVCPSRTLDLLDSTFLALLSIFYPLLRDQFCRVTSASPDRGCVSSPPAPRNTFPSLLLFFASLYWTQAAILSCSDLLHFRFASLSLPDP